MPRMFGRAALALACLLAAACGGRTTVILLPDEAGKIGAVTVKANGDSKLVDTAFKPVTIDDDKTVAESDAADEATVNRKFARVLAAQPTKAKSFLLYFTSGSTELTKESQAMLPQIAATVQERRPTEVLIIGHTDTTGTDDGNEKLSQQRAKAIELLLTPHLSPQDRVKLEWFGAKELLIPTPPNTAEPKNRRVEILVL